MMIESSRQVTAFAEQAEIDAIVSRGPAGALALAGAAVALVLAMWFIFYFLVFLPRT